MSWLLCLCFCTPLFRPRSTSLLASRLLLLAQRIIIKHRDKMAWTAPVTAQRQDGLIWSRSIYFARAEHPWLFPPSPSQPRGFWEFPYPQQTRAHCSPSRTSLVLCVRALFQRPACFLLFLFIYFASEMPLRSALKRGGEGNKVHPTQPSLPPAAASIRIHHRPRSWVSGYDGRAGGRRWYLLTRRLIFGN